LEASIAFRHYLARRDVFVRQAARAVFKWRRLLVKNRTRQVEQHLAEAQKEATDFARAIGEARKAARSMWRRPRAAQIPGPNEAMLDADERRLGDWLAWLRRAQLKPAIVMEATPVCGAWQLQFWVHNFAPAVQKVVVEQREPDGTWRELAARYTIEFRAHAAWSRSRIRREFSVPINVPEFAVRIALRGVGQVAISHIHLTDGIKTKKSIAWTQKHILGQAASRCKRPGEDLVDGS